MNTEKAGMCCEDQYQVRCPWCHECYYPSLYHICRSIQTTPASTEFVQLPNSTDVAQAVAPGIIERLSAQIASLEQTQLRMQRHIERRDKIISGLRGALHRIASGNVTPENAPALAAKALFENDYHSDVDEAAGLLEGR